MTRRKSELQITPLAAHAKIIKPPGKYLTWYIYKRWKTSMHNMTRDRHLINIDFQATW